MTDSVSLREHLEAQITWLDRYVDGKLRAIDVSTEKALAQLDKRLEGMNEFRSALKDTTAQQATKRELIALKEQIEVRLGSLEVTRAEGEGKVLIISGIVAFFASVLVAVIARWLTA